MPPPRLIDQRTGEPLDYDALLAEAKALSEESSVTVPAACRTVAEQANADHAESIVRHLQRIRNDPVLEDTTPAVPVVPLAGWGAVGELLFRAASQLEDQWNDLGERQRHTEHEARTFHRRAIALYDVASRRYDYLTALEPRDAAEALRAELGDLEQTNASLALVAFFEAELAAMVGVLQMTSRVATSAQRIFDDSL